MRSEESEQGDLKRDLRAEVRARLSRVSDTERSAWSAGVESRVMGLEAVKRGRAVLVFADVAAWKEPSMDGVARRLLGAGVRVASPRMGIAGGSVKTDPRVEACWIGDWDGDFERALRAGGTVEVRSPREGLAVVDPREIDVAIVPGLAFDAGGGRLGRGGGWYDRFLPRLRADAVKIGVAFEVQIVEGVPVEGHDVRMDWVVTEGREMRVGSGA